MNDILLSIPHELLSLILDFLDVSSIFSLSLTAKKYLHNKIVRMVSFGKFNMLNNNDYPNTTVYIVSLHLDAVSKGHIDLFKWFTPSDTDMSSSIKIMYLITAIKFNQLKIVKYFYESGYPRHTITCTPAAEYGHLEMLKYLHENGTYWDKWTCTRAAENGHLEILKYLCENGCPWQPDKDTQACFAAKNGHLEVLKYLRTKFNENGFVFDSTTICYYAISNGHLAILKYLQTEDHKNRHLFDINCYNIAIRNRYLDIVKYLCENQCPWDIPCFAEAVATGDMEIIKYLYENECPCNEAMHVVDAAILKRFDIVDYLCKGRRSND